MHKREYFGGILIQVMLIFRN